MKFLLWVAGIIGAILLLGSILPKPPSPPPDPRWVADVMLMRALKASMHDPGSFEVVQVIRMPDRVLCITYRARR